MIMEIALLATGALGTLGWVCAWSARGEIVERDDRLMNALAGENAAKGMALESSARMLSSVAKLADAEQRLVKLQNQLDGERSSRQHLVDALAKSGRPVGDAVVDSALDRLYPDGDPGGQGAGSRSGGDQAGLSGQPAPAAPAPPKG